MIDLESTTKWYNEGYKAGYADSKAGVRFPDSKADIRFTVLVEVDNGWNGPNETVECDSWGDRDAAGRQAEYVKCNGWKGLTVVRVWVAQEV